jgi:hypothetical protein
VLVARLPEQDVIAETTAHADMARAAGFGTGIDVVQHPPVRSGRPGCGVRTLLNIRRKVEAFIGGVERGTGGRALPAPDLRCTAVQSASSRIASAGGHETTVATIG